MEYSKLKLKIYESCDSGEITESEKAELLEKLENAYCEEKTSYDHARQVNYWKQMIDSYKKKINSCTDEKEKRNWVLKMREAEHHLKMLDKEKAAEEEEPKKKGIGMHGKMHVAFNSAETDDVEIDDNAITLEDAMNTISSYLDKQSEDTEVRESFTLGEAMNYIDNYLKESSDDEKVSLDEMKMAIYEKELCGEISVEERNELLAYAESIAE